MRIFESWDMLSLEGAMRPGDVYMEVGAHRGRFLEASGLLRPDCTYVLYEPGDVRRELRAKFGGNLNVIVHSEAIWKDEGVATYHVDGSEGQGNTLVVGVHPASFRVETVSLGRALVRDKIKSLRFLALNAEQAEYEILRAPEMAQVEYATVEFHPGKSGIDTRAFLAEHLPKWEILQFGREGEPYNQVLMVNSGLVNRG